MATTDLRRYLQVFSNSLAQENSALAAKCLSLNDELSLRLGRQLSTLRWEGFLGQFLKGKEDQEICRHFFNTLDAFHQGNVDGAFNNESKLIRSWRDRMAKETGNNWGLKPLDTLCLDLRLLAARVDDSLTSRGEKAYALEQAMSDMNYCFQLLSSDKSEKSKSKKKGMIFVVNHLLCIAFKLNNFAFLKSMIRIIDGHQEMMSEYATSHVVTYRYYMGRKSMYDADYVAADDHLTYALTHCHKKADRNKRLILIHLIPVNLLLGRFPTDALLERYDLRQFQVLTAALKQGDLRRMNQELLKHQGFFVSWGIFMILEKLKMLAFRNLFKRVHCILQTPKIKLSALLTAVHFVHEDEIDMEELECILANLIHQQYIKGYIAHQHQILVVSQREPFPAITKL